MSQIPNWFRFALEALTILGGLHGIAITLVLFFKQDVHGFGTFALLACGLAAYMYVTVAGAIFLQDPKRLRPLFCALAIQIPWISTPGLVYKFAAGLVGSVAFVANHVTDTYSAGFATNWDVGSSWEFRLFQNAPIQLGVNLVALAALVFLRKLGRLTQRPVSQAPPSSDGQRTAATMTKL